MPGQLPGAPIFIETLLGYSFRLAARTGDISCRSLRRCAPVMAATVALRTTEVARRSSVASVVGIYCW